MTSTYQLLPSVHAASTNPYPRGSSTQQGEKKNACPYNGCSASFNKPSDLERHVDSSKHENAPNFACQAPGCGKRYNRRYRLEEHERHCLQWVNNSGAAAATNNAAPTRPSRPNKLECCQRSSSGGCWLWLSRTYSVDRCLLCIVQ
jgi:hypothetical protein